MVFLGFSLRNSSYNFVSNKSIHSVGEGGEELHKIPVVRVFPGSLVTWLSCEQVAKHPGITYVWNSCMCSSRDLLQIYAILNK